MTTETRQVMARLLAGVAEYVMEYQDHQMRLPQHKQTPINTRDMDLLQALTLALVTDDLSSGHGGFDLVTPEKVIHVSLVCDREGTWHTHVGWDRRTGVIVLDQHPYSYKPEG